MVWASVRSVPDLRKHTRLARRTELASRRRAEVFAPSTFLAYVPGEDDIIALVAKG